ncbi:MAG: ABC transporter substrate-binding protein [Caldilinea sp.]
MNHVTGSTTIGYGDTGALVVGRSEGVPVKLIGMVLGLPPHAVIYKMDTPINTPQDLEGKKIGAAAGDTVRRVFPAFAQIAGFDIDQVQFETIGYEIYNAELLSGRIDGLAEYYGAKPNYDAVAQENDIELGILKFADYGLDVYSNGFLLRGLTLLGLLVIWQVVTVVFNIPKWLLPSPTAILEAMIKNAGALWTNSLVTLYESLAGFLLSVLIGVPLAVLIVWSPYLRNTVYPILLLFQSIPKTAIAPLIVIWFGHGISSKVIVAFLVAFFPIVVDTAAGLMSVEGDMLNLSRSLKSSRAQEFRYIRLPNALPTSSAAPKWRSRWP